MLMLTWENLCLRLWPVGDEPGIVWLPAAHAVKNPIFAPSLSPGFSAYLIPNLGIVLELSYTAIAVFNRSRIACTSVRKFSSCSICFSIFCTECMAVV